MCPSKICTCPVGFKIHDVPALTNVLPGWTSQAALNVQSCLVMLTSGHNLEVQVTKQVPYILAYKTSF